MSDPNLRAKLLPLMHEMSFTFAEAVKAIRSAQEGVAQLPAGGSEWDRVKAAGRREGLGGALVALHDAIAANVKFEQWMRDAAKESGIDADEMERLIRAELATT